MFKFKKLTTGTHTLLFFTVACTPIERLVRACDLLMPCAPILLYRIALSADFPLANRF